MTTSQITEQASTDRHPGCLWDVYEYTAMLIIGLVGIAVPGVDSSLLLQAFELGRADPGKQLAPLVVRQCKENSGFQHCFN